MRPPAGGDKPRPYGSITLAKLLRQDTNAFRVKRATSGSEGPGAAGTPVLRTGF